MSKFALITQKDIALLMSKGASSTTISVYLCLLSHAHHPKAYCDPKIETILKWIGNTVKKRQIHKCLKWLEDNSVIVRNDRSDKNRFVIISRLKSTSTTKKKKKESPQDTMNKGTESQEDTDSVPGGQEIESQEDTIREVLKENVIDHSISNEVLDLEEWIDKEKYEEELKQKIESDPMFHAQCIIRQYEKYEKLTGNVIDQAMRKIIFNQYNDNRASSQSSKSWLIGTTIKRYLENPFRKKKPE